MVQSGGKEQHALCELVDQGAYYLTEFADKQCCPLEGAAVHGGLHILQLLAASHIGRIVYFPPMSQTFKVQYLCPQPLKDSFHASVCASVHTSVRPSVHLFFRTFINPIHPSVRRPSVHLSIHPPSQPSTMTCT